MQVRQTDEFAFWLSKLRDRRSLARIADRLDRVARFRHFGVTRSLGEGLHEMKLDFGPGYRLYYGQQNDSVVLILLGGDKSTQRKDILRAKQILLMWNWED